MSLSEEVIPKKASKDAAGASDAPTPAEGTKKLSNKELKELKKREKAAKRSAKKQESGISIEQQQQQAQAKREKKQQQREQQLQHQKEQQRKQEERRKKVKQNLKKNTLFGHLETTAERRATILAVTGAISSSKASRITAAGLMLPAVTSALTGSQIPINSSLHTSSGASTATSGANTTNGGSGDAKNDISKGLASMSLESEEFSVVPGVGSVIPNVIEQSFDSPQLVSSVKELLLNKEFIHPAVSLLTSRIANYMIVGSIPRCIAMLEAFQTVIRDYQTPSGTTLSRNLTSYLSHQIDILKKARPLSVTMGNAIRWLKQEISLIDPCTPDKEAKRDLCEKIAQFAREKIELADQLIIGSASDHVENNSTIVTYGSSKVLTDLLLHNAVDLQKKFKVIVVDSRPLFEGRKMADVLRSHGVDVTYALITSLDGILNMSVDYVFLGAHSILSNGFLYSRVGTAMLAMSAKRRNIPVLVCCESLKFSQRVQLDSVTFNELADPEDLTTIDSRNLVDRNNVRGTLLKQFLKERKEEKQKMALENKANNKSTNGASSTRADSHSLDDDKAGRNILDGWQNIPSLNIVNILYDLTPPEYIKKIITEFGALPPSSVPVILREYKSSA
ncbi:hypothetical protein HG536_0B01710 [Torulaspora globosa]|uniref:Translation initiation factor eIF2B subunit delta n=1 Tax=Torulaspora globosa TaxID=48254 RepID=A0A7G3ZCS2_9SACH|nr:uncharacterized protein HG536_0B01710 [Torulaspora globosa]QLL31308.1 hypothetical protein HG536_0B01710 [Torulaspora globosa]